MRKIIGAAGLTAAAVLTLAACGSSASSSTSASANTPAAAGSGSSSSASSSTAANADSGGSALMATTIDGTKVLANSQGFVLYSFAPDSATASKCSGSCATFWPPVTGPASAGTGVTGKLTSIARSGGTMQAVYDGHPLYTFKGDTKPAEDKGNNVDASGGLWKIVPVSGTSTTGADAKASSSSTSGSGGGYGY